MTENKEKKYHNKTSNYSNNNLRKYFTFFLGENIAYQNIQNEIQNLLKEYNNNDLSELNNTLLPSK